MIKQENEGKSMIDCLNILVNELRHLQHDFSLELQNEIFMQNQLIIGCEKMPTCQLTCYKHSSTLTDQIIDLHTSINAYEKSHRSGSETENFFIDRRYHRGSDRGSNNQKFQFRQSSFRVFIFYQSRSRPPRGKKKCFVCDKKGCWSINHTDKKKNETMIRFKNKLGRDIDKKSFHYIIEVERINPDQKNEENDDLNDLNEIMKNFILNAISVASTFFKFENFETFFTSFEALQHAEVMIINLNQRAFEHGLEIISIEFLNDFEASDPFAYVISDRYISDEFYEIMIDTDASKYSIVDYEQYLIYKAIYDVNIDFFKTGAIYVQFGIEFISFIGFIAMAIFIGQVEFHIVKTDTPFLLCLADLDRLKVYFNNVENVLISKKENREFSIIRRFGHFFFL